MLGACYAPHPQAGAPCPDGVCPTGRVCSPATRTCEVTAENADARVADAPPDIAEDANVDADTARFLHRRRITIRNLSSSTMPAGMTVTVPFATLSMLLTSGKVNGDFSDLRVIGDTVGARDRILDDPSGPAPVAFHFSLGAPIAANATSTEYAVYYTNPASGPAPANGRNVFPIYEDFPVPLAPLRLHNDAPMLSKGQLVLRSGHGDAITRPAATDNIPVISSIELVARVPDPSSDSTVQPDGTFFYWFGYQHTGDFNASDPWVVWIARAKNSIGVEQESPVGCEMNCMPTPGAQDSAAHYYAVVRNTGETRFLRDSAAPTVVPVSNTTDYSLMIRNFMATSDVDVEWVRARARVNPEPAITLGAEENLKAFTSSTIRRSYAWSFAIASCSAGYLSVDTTSLSIVISPLHVTVCPAVAHSDEYFAPSAAPSSFGGT